MDNVMINGCMLQLPAVVGTALEVIAGVYGNDEDRVLALKKAGYDYVKVQHCVNDLLVLFQKYKD